MGYFLLLLYHSFFYDAGAYKKFMSSCLVHTPQVYVMLIACAVALTLEKPNHDKKAFSSDDDDDTQSE